MNNAIEISIGNTGNVNFNVDSENQDIGFVTTTNDDIDVNVGNENEEVSMEIQDNGSGFNFQLRETPMSTNNYERLVNKPSINEVELIGNKTLDDLGIVNDKTYFHNQTVASDTWVIIHNLNKYPSVTVLNSANEEVIGDIVYDNANQVTISFIGAFKGKATLN